MLKDNVKYQIAKHKNSSNSHTKEFYSGKSQKTWLHFYPALTRGITVY